MATIPPQDRRTPTPPPGAIRHGWLIVVAAVLLLLVAATAALAAYDSSRGDDIAEGVTVGGVDVGGLSAEKARGKLRRQLIRPLRRGVVVTWRGRDFRLSGRRARVDADVEGMVRRAVARSREGIFLSRAVRDLSGGEVEAEIPAKIAYSKSAVAGLVRRVKHAVDRPAQDARVDPSATGLRKVPARKGRAVRTGLLRRKVVHALLHRADVGAVRPSFRVTRPKVTTAQLASRHPWYITIDRSSFKLRVFRRLRLLDSYTIAVGQAGYDSPPGMHSIMDKQVNPAWHVPPDAEWAGELRGRTIPPGDPQNPLKARWMAYAPGGFGIHGTAETGSLGSRASHGCIRMSVPDVVELYDRVPLGTPLYLGG
ncbi:MAG: L,D-transpeptidase/peptidoglycan binding protein [Actinomycetota bacterium]|nr:L,D-transpeptidase/peptidoglycan binding protein [Actinomycetota bacterium]